MVQRPNTESVPLSSDSNLIGPVWVRYLLWFNPLQPAVQVQGEQTGLGGYPVFVDLVGAGPPEEGLTGQLSR